MADGRRGLSRVWSRRAAAVAAIAVFFDGVLHYALPSAVAIQEGVAYFAVKFAVVEVVAAVSFAAATSSVRLFVRRSWLPLGIGVVGSSAFGAIYYAFPWISAQPGYLSLPYRGFVNRRRMDLFADAFRIGRCALYILGHRFCSPHSRVPG